VAEDLKRVIYLGKRINDESTEAVITKLMELDIAEPKSPIRFVINTFGGCVDSQFAIYDAMRVCSAPVLTVGIGKIMSAGVLLLASGAKGSRVIAKNARVMIHEVSSGGWNKISEFKNSALEVERQQQQWEQLMAYETGNPIGDVRALMEKHIDQYMTAKEAVAFGIADTVV